MTVFRKERITIFIVTALTFIETFGQTLLHYGRTKQRDNVLFPLLTWVGYGLCTMLLYWSYGYSSMGFVEMLWDAFTTLSVPLVDYLINGTELNRIGLVGMFLTFMGTCCIAYSKIAFAKA